MITQEKLKSIVHYNLSTGVFTNLQTRSSNCIKGQELKSKNKIGYIRIMIDNKSYFAHRLAWLYVYNEYPKIIDHKNKNKSDNRIENLINCTQKENQRNRKLSKNNQVGFNGVHKRYHRYIASIKVNGKKIYIGSFSTAEEAYEKRKEYDVKYGFSNIHGNKE